MAIAIKLFTVLHIPAVNCIVYSTSTVTAEFLLYLLFYWPLIFVPKLLYWLLLDKQLSMRVCRGMPLFRWHRLFLGAFHSFSGLTEAPQYFSSALDVRAVSHFSSIFEEKAQPMDLLSTVLMQLRFEARMSTKIRFTRVSLFSEMLLITEKRPWVVACNERQSLSADKNLTPLLSHQLIH